MSDGPVGPVDATVVPRYAGPATFARLPRLDEVRPPPTSRSPACRSTPASATGPAPGSARRTSGSPRGCCARTTPPLGVSPFGVQQVADAGDIACNPFDIGEAITADRGGRPRPHRRTPTAGDARRRPHHRAAVAARRMHARHGPVAVLHFDAHLDTWDTYFGEPYTHGTPFRRAVRGGPDRPASTACTSASAARSTAPRDLAGVDRLGFARRRTAPDYETASALAGVIERDARAAGRRPGLRLASTSTSSTRRIAPGTGTPEAGGLTSPRTARHAARAGRARTSSRPTSSRSPPPTTTPRSPASPRPTWPTNCVLRHGARVVEQMRRW